MGIAAQIAHAKWLNAKHTRFECDYNHPQLGWVPFTADVNDKSEITKELFNNLVSLEIAEYVEPTVDLEELKELKHTELKKLRDSLRMTETIEFDGDQFTAGKEDDQNNMNTFYSKAVAMKAGIVERKLFSWMSATNELHTFTPEEIIVLATLMENKVQDIYARYWYARDVLLANATTKEEVDGITIPPTRLM